MPRFGGFAVWFGVVQNAVEEVVRVAHNKAVDKGRPPSKKETKFILPWFRGEYTNISTDHWSLRALRPSPEQNVYVHQPFYFPISICPKLKCCDVPHEPSSDGIPDTIRAAIIGSDEDLG